MEYPSPDPVLGTRGRVLGELLTLTHHMPHRAGRGEGSCIMRRKSRLSQGRELASHATLRPPGALARVTCNSVRSKLSHVPEPRALSLHKPRTCKPSVSPASKPFLSASCSSGQSASGLFLASSFKCPAKWPSQVSPLLASWTDVDRDQQSRQPHPLTTGRHVAPLEQSAIGVLLLCFRSVDRPAPRNTSLNGEEPHAT